MTVQRYVVEVHPFAASLAASLSSFEILIFQLFQAFWLVWLGRRIRRDCHRRYFLLVFVSSVVRREVVYLRGKVGKI